MRVKTRHRKPNRHVRLAAVALTGTTLLAACDAVGGGSATNDLSEAEKSRLAEEYRNCMEEGGLIGNVSFENNGVSIDVEIGPEAETLPEEEILAIEIECEKLLEEVDSGQEIDPEDEARLIDAAADVQQCLAKAGYVVDIGPDGGVEFNSDNQDDFDDLDEAAYLEAEDACYREVVPDLYEKYGGGN